MKIITVFRSIGSSTRNPYLANLQRANIIRTVSSASNSSKQSKLAAEDEENEKLYSNQKETHFGFETVSEETKARKVRAVFENVADKYDLMNDFMSAGVHRVWKDIFISRLRPGNTTKLIDVAGGTGDIAFRFLKHTSVKPDFSDSFLPNIFPKELPFPFNINFNTIKSQITGSKRPQSSQASEEINDNNGHMSEDNQRSVLISDINPRMLEVGQKRAQTILTPSQQSRTDWLEGDAENLGSIPDNTFDAYTIAFGIRNCVHVDKVLSEAYRILRPGGRFMCLEFSHVNNSLIKWFYDQYSFQIIPVMGQVVAGDWDSYLYLVQSIRKFPNQEDFKAMIQEAGFRFVKYENLTLGVACIHSGFKL